LKSALEPHREKRGPLRQVELSQIKPSCNALHSTVFLKFNPAPVLKNLDIEQHFTNEKYFVSEHPFMGIQVLHDEWGTHYLNVDVQFFFEFTYQR